MTSKTYKGTYLVLSLKWSDGKDHLIWWGPDNAGYTADLDKAGRYTAEQVAANPSYYDNEDSTRAVKLYDVMEGLIGPIRRIVAASYNRPRQVYDCHACLGEVSIHPEASPLTCAQCEAYICSICYDEGRCSVGAEIDLDHGRHTAQEPGT